MGVHIPRRKWNKKSSVLKWVGVDFLVWKEKNFNGTGFLSLIYHCFGPLDDFWAKEWSQWGYKHFKIRNLVCVATAA
jgi:hypothetical protein